MSDRLSLEETIARLGLRTDKTTLHSYGDFYGREFARFRDEPIALLEIGVWHGGSLRLWRECFPRAEVIVGIDLFLSQVVDAASLRAAGVTLMEGYAYCPETAARVGEFDIIIDDGDHRQDSQVRLLELYLPHLNPGGVLVIEDVQSSEWLAGLAAAVPVGFEHEVVDLRGVKGRSDDLLFVVRRR